MAGAKQTKPNQARSRLARLGDALVSLQFKATALVVVLTLSVTIAVAAYLLRSSGELARQLHGEQILTSAALLAKAGATLIESDQLDELDQLARESANGQPLMYVIFMNAAGDTLAGAEFRNFGLLRGLQTSHERLPSPGTPTLHSQAEQAPMFIDLNYPITTRRAHNQSTKSTQLVGYVRAGMAVDSWQRTMSSRLDMVIGVGVLAMIAAVPLGFLLVQRLVTPLDSLAQAMISFSTGRMDVRSSIRRRDELGRLAQAFNQMADQHQQTHMRIVRLNAELEERVAYRTHQLRELASRDPLTGLYNRRFFSDVLQRCYAEANRYRTDLSCIMIDLDDFKSANDAFGHQVGDQVLQLAAGTIVGQLRTSDVAARYGGDEFILLLPQTDAERAQILGTRVVERFNNELGERFPKSTVRMSMGIASLGTMTAENAESLIQAADNALYQAKASGKNRIVMAVSAA